MRSLTRALLAGSIAAAGTGPVAAPAGAHPAIRSDAVSAWNANAGDAAIAACLAPTTTRCTNLGCTPRCTWPSTTR
jgi:hypothetical protein